MTHGFQIRQVRRTLNYHVWDAKVEVLILLFAVLLFNGLRCAVLIVDTRKWSMDPV